MTKAQNNSYLTYPMSKTNPRLRLFCFPYAGGSSRIFQNWPKLFPDSVEVCPLQYPGRGNRLREPPFNSITALAADVTESILPLFDIPFAFFGHSMGATVAFEVARELRRTNKTLPIHLFVSGCNAPHLPKEELFYNLPEPEFIDELRLLKGTPAEVLEHPELMELLMPMLRADFEAVQTYDYVPEAPLSCPISAYGGSEDEEVPEESLKAWREHTAGTFTLEIFSGDHFYLQTSESLLTSTLISELAMSDKL